MWHGQNNQPSTDLNSAMIRESSLRMWELLGARDARGYFKSILGMRACAWNGSRIVVAQNEDAAASTGVLYELEQWYEAMFPGQWRSPRLALLAAAGSTPDVTHPGMTERQVADTYGIVPFSFYGGSSGPATWPVPLASMVFRDYWSTAGLPSGGSPNDYYLRIGGGTVGALLVNEAGTWVERSTDVIHLGPAGAEAESTSEVNFILNNFF